MSPLPARMTPSDSEAALGMKFLDVCQELTSKGILFTCTLTIGSTINLSLDTRGKEKKEESTTPLARKKSSPSTSRRNARRKALYLEKKGEERRHKEMSEVSENTTSESFPDMIQQLDGPPEGLESMDITPAVEKAQPIKCEHCDFKAETMQHMKTHINCNHQGFKCDYCEYKNISRDTLRKHMQKKHKNQSNERHNASPFTCSYCGEACENTLNHHVHEVYCPKRVRSKT